MTAHAITTMTEAEWRADGLRRFGPNLLDWQFVCPSCGHVQTAREYQAAGAPESAIGFSCVGRWMPRAQTRDAFASPAEKKRLPDGPCDYAGGGLFRLNPVLVAQDGVAEPIQMFAFADATGVADGVR